MSYRKNDKEFERWAKSVKIRDQWTCQICNARGVYLEAHHKNAFNAFPEQRYVLDNGVTLCSRCHNRFHEIYDYGNNTEEQFKQYEEIALSLRKIAEEKVNNKI